MATHLPKCLRRLWTLAPALCLLLPLAASGSEDVFAPIKKRLIEDGLSPHRTAMAFEPAPPLQLKLVAQTLRIRESRLNYDQFLQPACIAKGEQFLRAHGPILAQAEATYGVDRCVIVAILLVETQLGSYTGRTPTLAVLSTFALMDQPGYRDKIWGLLSARDRAVRGREAFDQKLMDRSKWAYQELRALLKWTEKESMRPEDFKGSVMGAVGWPQFLPSSLMRFGIDGNSDGRVDLYTPVDAIHSVANYLRGHGWSKAKSRTDQEAVIHCYNKSRPYVNAVLGVAERLRR